MKVEFCKYLLINVLFLLKWELIISKLFFRPSNKSVREITREQERYPTDYSRKISRGLVLFCLSVNNIKS